MEEEKMVGTNQHQELNFMLKNLMCEYIKLSPVSYCSSCSGNSKQCHNMPFIHLTYHKNLLLRTHSPIIKVQMKKIYTVNAG
jgi:hypothetical protein